MIDVKKVYCQKCGAFLLNFDGEQKKTEWKKGSEITEPGSYWVADCRGPKEEPDIYVTQIYRHPEGTLYAPFMSISEHGRNPESWTAPIFVSGPLEKPEAPTIPEQLELSRRRFKK